MGLSKSGMASETLGLSSELGECLAILGRQENATLFTVLLAGFKILLAHQSGQDDPVVNTSIIARDSGSCEQPTNDGRNERFLHTDLSGDPTVIEVLARVRDATLRAADDQEAPFDTSAQQHQIAHSLGSAPVFQAMLGLQNAPASEVRIPDLEIRVEPAPHTGTSKFDLVFSLEEGSEGICCTLQYNTELFEAATIRRMLGHYEKLLEGMSAAPGQRIGQLPMLSDQERQQILEEWNDTGRSYPRERCVHRLFEEQVERTPESVAVVFEDRRLSYHELNARSNRLAHFLQSLGVGPETLVAICVERSLEMVIGLLGILKAGGAYVPLDPKYPPERLRFMLHDTRASVLLTQQSLASSLPEVEARVVYLDTDWARIEDESPGNPCSTVTSHNLAYVIYTSGSTGKPKGVAIEHRNTVALIAWSHEVYSKSDLAGVLCSTSLCFDLSIFEIFVPLSCGGKAIIAPNAPGAANPLRGVGYHAGQHRPVRAGRADFLGCHS